MDSTTVLGGAVAISLIYAFYGFLLPRKLPRRSIFVGEAKPGETAVIRHPASKSQLVTTYYDDVTTLYELMKRSASKYANRPYSGARRLVDTIVEERDVKIIVDGEEKTEKKKWFFYQMGPFEWKTYSEVWESMLAVGSGLVSQEVGLTAGNSKLGIFANTCPEWFQIAHGCFSQSITVVTVYANLGEEGLVHAVNEGELTHLFCNAELFPILTKVQTKCPSLKQIIYIDEPNKDALAKISTVLKVRSYEEVVKLGKANPAPVLPPKPKDEAIIMYTSGTTDLPKGVIMTHANMIASVSGAAHLVKLKDDDVFIAYLPLAHVLELCIECFCTFSGIKIGYASPRTLSDTTVKNCKGDLRELRPTLMGGVPAVWERIRKGAYAKIEAGSPLLRTVFNTAFAYKARLLRMGHQTPLLDAVIFKKLRDQTGGRVRIMLSGGAPISRESHEFLRVCFGCPVIQGYGLTECCGLATLLDLDDYHYERVGAPAQSMECKLVDVPDMKYLATDKPNPRGELWLRGGHITSGYYKNPKKTAEDYDQDGWFHTGDVAQVNSDGTLSIIDRKKNLVKLSHGEYIALEKLEAKYKGSKYVENICVYADSSRDYPVALIVPVKNELMNWASSKGLSSHFEEVCKTPEARKMILDTLKDIGRREGLKSYESVTKVHLVPDEWTPENDLITAAQKLKRNPIQAKYKQEIEALYKEK